MASGYYSARLAGERLRLAYELAPPRVRQYLEAEIQHVASQLPTGARVLELSCGYGRVLRNHRQVKRRRYCPTEAGARHRSPNNAAMRMVAPCHLSWAPAMIPCVREEASA
jgi:hypothetical protein